jgi:hypothetical protein
MEGIASKGSVWLGAPGKLMPGSEESQARKPLLLVVGVTHRP